MSKIEYAKKITEAAVKALHYVMKLNEGGDSSASEDGLKKLKNQLDAKLAALESMNTCSSPEAMNDPENAISSGRYVLQEEIANLSLQVKNYKATPDDTPLLGGIVLDDETCTLRFHKYVEGSDSTKEGEVIFTLSVFDNPEHFDDLEPCMQQLLEATMEYIHVVAVSSSEELCKNCPFNSANGLHDMVSSFDPTDSLAALGRLLFS